MGSLQKICCACSADVAKKKRVKDTQGNYYCEPCYAGKRADKGIGVAGNARSAPVAVAAAAMAPALSIADPYDFPPASSDEIGLAEEPPVVADAASPDMFGCADCKKLVPSKQIRNDDGDFVCHLCFGSRRAKQPAVSQAPRRSFAEQEGLSSEPGFKDTLLGGALIAAGVVVAAFFIFLALHLSGLEKDPGTILLAIITSGVQAVFVMFAAGSLIVSMFILARILGGCDFGTLGGALWKSTAIMLGFYLVNMYLTNLSGGIMIGLGFRGVLLVITFIVVFRLEYFEAALLSVINFFILLFLIVVMAILLASLHRAMSRSRLDADAADFDRPNARNNLPPLAPVGADAPPAAQPDAPPANAPAQPAQ